MKKPDFEAVQNAIKNLQLEHDIPFGCPRVPVTLNILQAEMELLRLVDDGDDTIKGRLEHILSAAVLKIAKELQDPKHYLYDLNYERGKSDLSAEICGRSKAQKATFGVCLQAFKDVTALACSLERVHVQGLTSLLPVKSPHTIVVGR